MATRRKKSSPPKPVVVETTLTADDIAATSKEQAAMPSWGDIRSAFGEKAAIEKNVNLDMSTREGRDNRGKFKDMMKPWLGTQVDLQHKNAAAPRATLRTSDGKEVKVYAETEEAYARKHNLHAKPFWGRPTERIRFSLVGGVVVREVIH